VGQGILVAIAREAGTPTYVYDACAIRAQYARLSSAFQHLPHRIHYSVKANSNLGVLGVLEALGAGVDIVSGGELYRAMRAGFTPADVVFSGVGKSVTELSEAIRVGVGLINIESRAELEVLTRLASGVGKPIELGIRINPDVEVDTHPYTRTGTKGMKFGVPADSIIEIARTIEAEPHLKLTAVGVHIGSQIRDANSFREAAGRLREVVYQLRGVGVKISRVDVGGGLGIRYRYEEVLSPEEYADALSPLADLDVELVLEPGRFLVGNAGVLLTTCIYMKQSGGRSFAIMDGGMNDLVRPSWYQAEHEITVVSALEPGAITETVDVVGPLCEAGDFLGLERELTGVHAGAVLAVHGAGAYGFAMSSNYNSRPRAAEVLIDADRWTVTRDRETMTDLVRGERSLEYISDPDWCEAPGGAV